MTKPPPRVTIKTSVRPLTELWLYTRRKDNERQILFIEPTASAQGLITARYHNIGLGFGLVSSSLGLGLVISVLVLVLRISSCLHHWLVLLTRLAPTTTTRPGIGSIGQGLLGQMGHFWTGHVARRSVHVDQ